MQPVQLAQPFGYLQDPNKVEVVRQFREEGQILDLTSEHGKLKIERWSFESSDGYNFLVGQRIVNEWDVTPGYRIEKKYGDGEVKECQITLFGPNDLAMRIDHLVLPEWLRKVSCPCWKHTPKSDIGPRGCVLEEIKAKFWKVEVAAVTDSESKKPYLVALVPSIRHLEYSVISLGEKTN